MDKKLPERLPVAVDNMAATRVQILHHLRCPGMAEFLPQHPLGDLVKPLARAGEEGDHPRVPVHVAENKEEGILTNVSLEANTA